MKVYEIDDGAIYFVAASDIREAVRFYWKIVDETGTSGDGNGFDAHEISDVRALHILINSDGRQENAWALAQRDGPGVLGCSEWP